MTEMGMTEAERIRRLEWVLGTLVFWLGAELGGENQARLLEMLHDPIPDVPHPSTPVSKQIS